MTMSNLWVTVSDDHAYPAVVDLTNRWNGWLSPGFTLDTVRKLAAHTTEAAEEYGHDCTDEIKIIDGPSAVVLHVRWAYIDDEGPSKVCNVVAPDENGLYWIGGWEWTWSTVEDGPIHDTKYALWEAWSGVFTATTRRVGEYLRALMPDADACYVDLTRMGHIVAATAPVTPAWVYADETEGDGYGPFDGETLGAADELVRRALDHGRDRSMVEMAGWRSAHNLDPALVKLTFPPASEPDAGDAALEAARVRFTQAHRAALAVHLPYLAEAARAAAPDTTRIRISLTDPARVHAFIDADGAESLPASTASEGMQSVLDRLDAMLLHRPTQADMTACDWTRVEGDYREAYEIALPA